MKNLVVARCGKNSLHPNWLAGESPEFDLIVTYYGDQVPEAWENQGYPIHMIKGSKWKGLYQFFNTHDIWREYDNILLPDDDLLFDAKTLNTFFRVVCDLNLDLAQPALDTQSYFTHPITLVSESFDFRITNFVEIMCPCLSRRFLEESLPLFAMSDSGYGMDNYWATLLDEKGFQPPVIVDRTTITHTRPVGSAGNGGSSSPMMDLQRFLRMKNITVEKSVNLAGILKTGRHISLTKELELFQLYLIKDLAHKLHLDVIKISQEIAYVADAYCPPERQADTAAEEWNQGQLSAHSAAA